jgi:tetratricopeptide (TPR) repeat protein
MESTALEKNQRLSESMIWKLQRAVYLEFGPQAWSQKGVPFYITSNPFTARQYAHVVLGYLRDCIAADSATPLDFAHPLYILDLGAGTGRFGYLFLKSLRALLRSELLRGLRICYVMTDIAEKNIAFWQQHSYLQPLIEEGVLDFSFYQVGQKEPLHLIQSQQILTKDHLVNPLILIGNYFFDTIPQDLFRIKNRTLEEGRISIFVDKAIELGTFDRDNPNIIPHMHFSFEYAPIKDLDNYYSDFSALNSLLKKYRDQFDDITFFLPVGAFQSIRYFSELSKERFLLLAGDQGTCTEEQMAKAKDPTISKHGSFSIPVNYYVISNYFIANGGHALLTTFPDPSFVVIGAIFGADILHLPETYIAFQSHIDYFEPHDYWNFVNYVEKDSPNPSLRYLLLLLKLGNWDPMNFNEFFLKIRQNLPHAPEEVRQELKKVIHKVWENFYPVSSEEGNFIMNLGVLFYDMKEYREALVYFKRSLELMGESPQILQNIAACYKVLGQ